MYSNSAICNAVARGGGTVVEPCRNPTLRTVSSDIQAERRVSIHDNTQWYDELALLTAAINGCNQRPAHGAALVARRTGRIVVGKHIATTIEISPLNSNGFQNYSGSTNENVHVKSDAIPVKGARRAAQCQAGSYAVSQAAVAQGPRTKVRVGERVGDGLADSNNGNNAIGRREIWAPSGIVVVNPEAR